MRRRCRVHMPPPLLEGCGRVPLRMCRLTVLHHNFTLCRTSTRQHNTADHLSHSSLKSSHRTSSMSNRLNNGPANAAFTANGIVGSNFPLGFVAAKTDVRVFSLHTRPALATLIVCCSMASCMTVLSPSRTPPNSSMQHTPPSARTNAPASSCQSPPPSRVAATVSPADVVPER